MSKVTRGARLILHGGMPKTGTTSIQVALRTPAWRAALNAARVRFLEIPHCNGNYTRYLNALRGLPAWRSPPDHARDVAAMAGSIRTALSTLPEGFSLLMSAETVGEVAVRDGDALRRIRDYLAGFFADIRLAIYVREPLSYACSRIQQAVRAGYPMSKALRSTLAGCDMAEMIGNSRAVFGRPKVIIRSFDLALMTSPDVVVDFGSSVLGVPPETTRELAARGETMRNRGLTTEMLEILLHFHEERGIRPHNISPVYANTLRRICWAGTRFGPGFFAEADRACLLETTNRVRRDVIELLGYDPFPSYRPFSGGTWQAAEADPGTHERNRELLSAAISELGVAASGTAHPMSARRPAGIGGGGAGSTAAARGSILTLLGQFYDLLDPTRDDAREIRDRSRRLSLKAETL